MSGIERSESEKHPVVSEHPEQRRQEETGREDASEAGEVGRPQVDRQPKKSENAA